MGGVSRIYRWLIFLSQEEASDGGPGSWWNTPVLLSIKTVRTVCVKRVKGCLRCQIVQEFDFFKVMSRISLDELLGTATSRRVLWGRWSLMVKSRMCLPTQLTRSPWGWWWRKAVEWESWTWSSSCFGISEVSFEISNWPSSNDETLIEIKRQKCRQWIILLHNKALYFYRFSNSFFIEV